MKSSIVSLGIFYFSLACTAFSPHKTKILFTKTRTQINLQESGTYENSNNNHQPIKYVKLTIGALLCAFYWQQPDAAHGASLSLGSSATKIVKDIDRGSNWERSRQKRTVAIKEMESKGIIKVVTDDSGSQILRFPWSPDLQVPYKSLSIQQRLLNEVCAGAFGEFCKDFLLHPVDTLKTRRQAQKKKAGNSDLLNGTAVSVDLLPVEENVAETGFNPVAALTQLKTLYSGFPIVMSASIPQGGTFFLIKKGLIETISSVAPATPDVIKSMVSIAFSVMGYWSFRTPAEIIKTQVQTGQAASVKESIETIRIENDGNFKVLWKYFPVMMWLDVPFQVMNFILYGIISDALSQAGFTPSTLTRLICGVASGMVCAGVTCPVDVCKTRIISRDKENSRRQKLLRDATQSTPLTTPESTTSVASIEIIDPLKPTMQSVDTATPVDMNLMSTNENLVRSTDTAPASTSLSPEVTENKSNAELDTNMNVPVEMLRIFKEEGIGSLFLGLQPRLLYTGLANGIRLAAYGTSRMDLMMRSLDDI